MRANAPHNRLAKERSVVDSPSNAVVKHSFPSDLLPVSFSCPMSGADPYGLLSVLTHIVSGINMGIYHSTFPKQIYAYRKFLVWR